jgi:hypothetical protein
MRPDHQVALKPASEARSGQAECALKEIVSFFPTAGFIGNEEYQPGVGK